MPADREDAIFDGAIAGVIGFVVVALFFLVLNVVSGRSPFHTPAALGSALFYGVTDPAAVRVEPGPVLAFNGVHVLLSAMLAIVAAWLVLETERHHILWYLAFFALIAGFMLTLGVIGIVGVELLGVVSWPAVASASVLWVLAAGGYLWIAHRQLMENLGREQDR